MNVREAYQESLRRDNHHRDAAQEAIVVELDGLQQRAQARASGNRSLLSLFGANRRARNDGASGLYIWGGVGRGKTFLMDLFYETLSIEAKRRIYFHRKMQEVHDRLAQLTDIENPLDQVAGDIARDARVLKSLNDDFEFRLPEVVSAGPN